MTAWEQLPALVPACSHVVQLHAHVILHELVRQFREQLPAHHLLDSKHRQIQSMIRDARLWVVVGPNLLRSITRAQLVAAQLVASI